MPEPGDKKNPVEEAMEKDCIILFTVNEVLAVMKDVLQYEEDATLSMEIDSKCRGPACAQYNVAFNRCGLM